jgi:hypothetical protein
MQCEDVDREIMDNLVGIEVRHDGHRQTLGRRKTIGKVAHCVPFVPLAVFFLRSRRSTPTPPPRSSRWPAST